MLQKDIQSRPLGIQQRTPLQQPSLRHQRKERKKPVQLNKSCIPYRKVFFLEPHLYLTCLACGEAHTYSPHIILHLQHPLENRQEFKEQYPYHELDGSVLVHFLAILQDPPLTLQEPHTQCNPHNNNGSKYLRTLHQHHSNHTEPPLESEYTNC